MLREKPLHASLKLWCATDGDLFEEPVDGFVIDVVSDDLLIEIQTGGFSSMKRKLKALLAADHRAARSSGAGSHPNTAPLSISSASW
jgi:hypothetical protein